MMEAPLEDVAAVGASAGIEGQELKASEEGIAFMSSIELQKCVFADSLVAVSEGGRDVGRFSVLLEFGHRVQQPCLLLHAQSHGDIDDSPCGTTVTEVPLEQDVKRQKMDDIYPLNSQPVGLCLIINNEKFSDVSDRAGSAKDAQSLAAVFSWLGFRVLMCKDQTKDQMKRTLTCFASLTDPDQLQEFNVEEWSGSGFTKPQSVLYHGDAFICCVLSHGENGVVFGVDMKPVSIKHVTTTFKATEQSALKGKPKVFLIEASQGSKRLCGVLQPDQWVYSSGFRYIPEAPDILIANSTVEDYVSYRHRIDGSWFIQSVCRQLREHCPRGEDLTRILDHVNNEVSQKEGSRLPGSVKQMPVWRSNMTKRLVLSPKRN